MAKKKDPIPDGAGRGLSALLAGNYTDRGVPIKKAGRPVKKKLKADKLIQIRIPGQDLIVLDELVLQAAEKYGIERTRTDLILFLLDKEYKTLNPKK